MYSSSSPQSVPKKKKAPVPKSSSSVVNSTSKKQNSVRQRQEGDENEEEEDESDVTDYSEPEPYVPSLFLHFISSLDDDMIQSQDEAHDSKESRSETCVEETQVKST